MSLSPVHPRLEWALLWPVLHIRAISGEFAFRPHVLVDVSLPLGEPPLARHKDLHTHNTPGTTENKTPSNSTDTNWFISQLEFILL